MSESSEGAVSEGEWQEALRRVGSRAGLLSVQGMAAQAEAEVVASKSEGVGRQRGRGGRGRGRGVHGVAGKVGTVGVVAEAHVKFECRHLQRLEGEGERQRWKTMSCEDEDDFTALKTHQWPVDAFVDGAEVVLWRADAETPIGCSEGFVRLARVERG